MPDKINVKELNKGSYEDAVLKNGYIRDTFCRETGKHDSDYLAFLKMPLTNQQEVQDVFEGQEWLQDYDAVIFGENVPEGEVDLFAMLDAFSMRIFGFWIKRSVLEYTGCFNEKLENGTNYEFLCRVAKGGRVFCVSCQGDEAAGREENEDGTEGNAAGREGNVAGQDTGDYINETDVKRNFAYTLAYVLKKYMVELQNAGRLDIVFSNMTAFWNSLGMLSEFNEYVKLFLENNGVFEKVAENTAPFFIISGDDTCHGVLKDFAASLGDELVSMGQAVITSDKSRGYFEDYSEISRMQFKGVVGFQAPILEESFFRRIKGKKLQFWFDNPVYFRDMFQNLPEDYYIFCQDAFYAEHIRKFYGVKNAMQFPPAGKDAGYLDNDERPYDIVFIGAYNVADESCIVDSFQREFYDYMIAHPENTFEKGLERLLIEKGICLEGEKFREILWSLAQVCRNVINYYREKTVETILTAGLCMHVFGDTWHAYQKDGKENLIIHPAVSVEESLEIMGKSKIGLNVMTWHKAGMTERIANIMLSGAVCVSDETVYLNNNFVQNEEIVLFSLNGLKELPMKLKKLLEEDEYRRCVAKQAYEKAVKEHTWRKRAEDILALLDGE